MNEIDYMRRIRALEEQEERYKRALEDTRARRDELMKRALAAESREARLRNELHECHKVIDANVNTLMWSDQAE